MPCSQSNSHSTVSFADARPPHKPSEQDSGEETITPLSQEDQQHASFLEACHQSADNQGHPVALARTAWIAPVPDNSSPENRPALVLKHQVKRS